MLDMDIYPKIAADEILNNILKYIRILTKSDASIIYFKEKNHLKFMVFQSESINDNVLSLYNLESNSLKLLLDDSNKNLVVVDSFLTNTVINIEDVYKDIQYDFGKLKEFDKVFNYRTYSIITVPLLHPFDKTIIGILQVINKKGINNQIEKFNRDDEITLNFASNFVSLTIINVQKYIDSFKLLNYELIMNLEARLQEKLKKNIPTEHEYQLSKINKVLQNIAHQWRHPLGELSFNNIYMYQIIDDKKLQSIIEDNNKIIQSLSRTIDNFEGVFDKSDEKSFFDVSIWIQKGLDLVSHYMKPYNITLELSLEKSVYLYGFSSIFSQIILSILENMVDIFKKSNINNQFITITSFKDNSNVIVRVEDTIPLNDSKKLILDIKILQFLIEEKFGGNLSYDFKEDGRKFTISLPNNMLLSSRRKNDERR